MTDAALVDLLMDAGGPVIRWRTATELLPPDAPIDREMLRRDLLASPLVRAWLDRLRPGKWHASADIAVENVLGKLRDFGLRAGMPPFDERMAPIRARAGDDRLSDLDRAIIAGGVLGAGYDDAPAHEFALRRLADIAATCREEPRALYADAVAFSGIPSVFRGRSLVRPDLVAHGFVRLPTVHDLAMLAHLPPDIRSDGISRKIDTVVRWVLRRDTQALPPGYGIMRSGPRRYHAIGWNIDLPGYSGFGGDDFRPDALVMRVELMARFAAARAHPWFHAALDHLDGFRTDRGTWQLPARYLREESGRYGVLGARMGLSEPPRTVAAREIEATFRMLRVRKMCEVRFMNRVQDVG